MKDRRILTPETIMWLIKMFAIFILMGIAQLTIAFSTLSGAVSIFFAIIVMLLFEIKIELGVINEKLDVIKEDNK